MLAASPVLAQVHGSQRSKFQGVSALTGCGGPPGRPPPARGRLRLSPAPGLVTGRAFVAAGVAVGTGRHALQRRPAPPAASPTAPPVMSRKPGFFTRRPVRAFNPAATPDARAVIGL
jgi:hypothetical protein